MTKAKVKNHHYKPYAHIGEQSNGETGTTAFGTDNMGRKGKQKAIMCKNVDVL
jgi:hypothetical protein